MAQYKQPLQCSTGYTVERTVHVKSKELTSDQDLRAESNGECNNLQDNVLLNRKVLWISISQTFLKIIQNGG